MIREISEGDLGAMDEYEPDDTLLNLSSYWIQGRQGQKWRNIESHKDPLRAVRHLQLLIINDQHDELRLIMARTSAITGEVEYSHMASFEGGGTRNPDAEELAEVLEQTRPWDPDHDTEPDAQIPLFEPESPAAEQVPLLDMQDLHQRNVAPEKAGRSMGTAPRPEWPMVAETPPDPPPAPRSLDEAYRTSFIPQQDRWRDKPPLSPPFPPEISPAPERRARLKPSWAKQLLAASLLFGIVAVGSAAIYAHPGQSKHLAMDLYDQIQLMLPNPALPSLIRAKDTDGVARALAQGADPNMRDWDGRPVMMIATDRQAYAILDLLLAAGADPHQRQPGGSILHTWAKDGDVGAIKQVLASGARPDSGRITEKCLSPLATAIAHGRLRSSLALARGGASLEAMPGCDLGPMDLAASHPDIFDRLSALQADRNAVLAQDQSRQKTIREGNRQLVSIDEETSETQETDSSAASDLPTAIARNMIPSDRLEKPASLPEPADNQDVSTDQFLSPSSILDSAPATVAEGEPNVDPDRDKLAIRPPERPAVPEVAAQPILDAAKLSDYLKHAIDRQDLHSLRHMLQEWPDNIAPSDIRVAASDQWGSNQRPIMDYALMQGQLEAAKDLSAAGFQPTDQLLHLALDQYGNPQFAAVTNFLLNNGAKVNSVVKGMTPLIRAVIRADLKAVDRLLARGADITFKTDKGETVLDFAKGAGRTDILERISVAYHEEKFRPVMFGLSWRDRLADVQDRVSRCQTVAEGFTACLLNDADWLPDGRVIVQFDNRAGGTLASIQVDSTLMQSPETAKERFEEVALEIQKRLPGSAQPHQARQAMDGPNFFTSLQPGSNTGAYYNYWSDKDQSVPIFIHLKLSGYDAGSGYYRVLIGNPFQAG
ncbi:ankyrin repeat domain-containing protein [Aestuariispira insulae]|uniref:Ankyrin repeat protein n=1 Tax=Aestuariispira insulae TaxID=1461337 RepID=A0A3D9HRT5_9PROT|nr:ankyrin repeat domain-containing protein [Aestuariispira insulae]RED52223.1 ankyrin repeat protein [Aestuariispira insulae]